MLAFRERKFSRSCRQSYTRLRNGRWVISRSRRLRYSRCWKRRTDYEQSVKAKSRSLTVIRKRRGLVRRPDPANLLVLEGDHAPEPMEVRHCWAANSLSSYSPDS